ncbi:3-deoxy-D-manno-octulosonic acid transferase [Desulfurobacterium sp.]
MRGGLFIYNLLYGVSLPALLTVAKFTSKNRGGFSVKRRFFSFPSESQLKERDIWIHCASIGEVNSARPLIEKLKDRLIVTTFTDYGADRALELFPEIPVYVIPPDMKPFTDRFVKSLGVKKLLVYETEIWPSLLTSAIEQRVEVYFISGKITESNFSLYKRFFPVFKDIFKSSVFLARSDEDAERAKKLGFKEVKTVGDLKFDSVTEPKPVDVTIGDRFPIIVWGSTHEGEEELAGKVHTKLKEKFPKILTIVVPRHVGRAESLRSILPGKAVLRTELKSVPSNTDFYIVDTIGELPSFYALGDVAVVGGTFNEKVGGHNLLEPMVSAVPVVVGPHYSHFQDVVSKVKECIIFSTCESVFDKISLLLKNDELRYRIGICSKRVLEEERGVTERILKEVFT